MNSRVRICLGVVVAVMALVSISCGGSGSSRDTVDSDDSFDISASVGGNPVEHVAGIDSLALNADDLDSHDAVAVLLGYVKVIDDADSRKQSRKRLITMRKFVDVYDITLSNNGNEMRNAIDRARVSTGIDLKQLVDLYREQLSGEDEAAGVEEGEAAPQQSAVQKPGDTDSLKTAGESLTVTAISETPAQ